MLIKITPKWGCKKSCSFLFFFFFFNVKRWQRECWARCPLQTPPRQHPKSIFMPGAEKHFRACGYPARGKEHHFLLPARGKDLKEEELQSLRRGDAVFCLLLGGFYPSDKYIVVGSSAHISAGRFRPTSVLTPKLYVTLRAGRRLAKIKQCAQT